MRLLEGKLSETSVDGVLLRLRGGAQTGILTLQNDEDIVAVSVEKGEIVGADALNESLEEGLGVVLVGEGLVTEAEFESAVSRVGAHDGRIGDLLIEDNLISREDYLAALRRYTMTLIRRIKTWDESEFKFYVGDEVSYEEGFEPIRIKEVLDSGAFEAAETPATPESDPEPAPSSPAADRVADPEDVGVDDDGAFTVEEASQEELEDSPPGTLRRRALSWLADAPDWVAQVAPLLVMLALAVVVVWRPNSLVYPFFWLETERLELEKLRRSSVYMKIDRASKTFFLLEGRFPDQLHHLVSRGLLGPEDVVGSGGRTLSYVPGHRGYTIRPGVKDGTDPGVSKIESIAGDFFLDPEFAIHLPDRGPPPLVLLD